VQDLAKARQVWFAGSSDEQAAVLGFSAEGAMECIEWLELAEFRKTLHYDDGKSWDDYVAVRICPATKTRRPIYIKLRVAPIKRDGRSAENVIVVSFHTEKPF